MLKQGVVTRELLEVHNKYIAEPESNKACLILSSKVFYKYFHFPEFDTVFDHQVLIIWNAVGNLPL